MSVPEEPKRPDWTKIESYKHFSERTNDRLGALQNARDLMALRDIAGSFEFDKMKGAISDREHRVITSEFERIVLVTIADECEKRGSREDLRLYLELIKEWFSKHHRLCLKAEEIIQKKIDRLPGDPNEM